MPFPDSALSITNKIDTSLLNTRKWRAKYSLLHTMAIDRCGADTNNINLILPAVDYYQSKGSVEDRVRALFYQGRILFNQGDYSSAFISLLCALDYAQAIDDIWLKGMICSYLGITYNRNHNNEDELAYCSKALDYFTRYGDPKYIDNSNYLTAVACHNNRLFAKSDSLFNCVDSNGAFGGPALIGRAENYLSWHPEEASRAVSLFEEASQKGQCFSLVNWFQYCYALQLSGRRSEASTLFNRLEPYAADASALWWKYCITKSWGDNTNALVYFEQYSQTRDSLVKAKLAQSLYKAEREHANYLAEKANNKATRIKSQLLFTVIVGLFALITMVLLGQRRRVKAKMEKEELAQKCNAAEEMLSLLHEQDEDRVKAEETIRNLQVSFATMYQNQFSQIGRLYNTNLDISLLADKGAQQYASLVSSVFSEISSKKQSQRDFEDRINHDLDNIMLKLRNDFPKFDEKTFRFLSYIIVGFKNPTIAAILNEKITTVSTRKSRLKQEIYSHPTPNTTLYKAFIR